ncbi:MAG: hypothetical protein U5L45_00265 [Saprospiraceae bacterium]|nr:hypothetical protein [Saprospiraceae bacterium]
MNPCLYSFFGLSNRVCECPDFANQPIDASISGYYIDQKLGYLQDFTYANCGDGSIWDILQRAKDTAILDFQSDIAAQLHKGLRERIAPFSGQIGKAPSGIISSAQRFNGIRFYGDKFTGVKMILKSLQIGTTLGGATTVKFWKNNELLFSQNVNLLPNQMNQIVLTSVQDFVFEQDVKYAVTYDLVSGSYPLSNLISCGCAGENNTWKKMATVEGVTMQNEEDVFLVGGNSSANGIILNALVYCDFSQWFCWLLKEFGDISEDFLIVANALTFKAAMIATQHLLDSNLINFSTLTNKEALYGKRAHFEKEYNTRVEYLATRFPASKYNCFLCSSINQINRRSLIL